MNKFLLGIIFVFSFYSSYAIEKTLESDNDYTIDELLQIIQTGEIEADPNELNFYKLENGEVVLSIMHVQRYRREDFLFYCFPLNGTAKILYVIKMGDRIEYSWIKGRSSQR